MEGILIILDIHILEFILAQVLLLDVFHYVFFMPLAFLIFNGHVAAVLGVLLFNFTSSSLVVSPRLRTPTCSILIWILISLVFNVVAKVICWHVMVFLCSKFSILLLPLTVPLLFTSDSILLLLIVLALIELSSWLRINPIIVLRSLHILVLIVALPLLLMVLRRNRLLLEVLLVLASIMLMILPILRRNRLLVLILPLHRLLLTWSTLCLISSCNRRSFL